MVRATVFIARAKRYYKYVELKARTNSYMKLCNTVVRGNITESRA